MKNQVFDTLKLLGCTSEETKELFNTRTRDVDDLKVWKDSKSGVIFIDQYYTGDDSYVSGNYREKKAISLKTGMPDYERVNDAQRRFNSNFKYIIGKKILDFGCGGGEFLRLAKSYCQKVIGVELQMDYMKSLNDEGINCFDDLDKIDDKSIDTALSFHVIEHLPNPIEVLRELLAKVITGGKVIIEVPHANDFLLKNAECEQFKQFTLWSQHLVLHTRYSLKNLLQYVGFQNIIIQGVQRYPLSNHLNWLANGLPGGHKSIMSALDTEALNDAYSKSLAMMDATDTLVATAYVS
jgi:SAM-dependent methyltransferase